MVRKEKIKVREGGENVSGMIPKIKIKKQYQTVSLFSFSFMYSLSC